MDQQILSFSLPYEEQELNDVLSDPHVHILSKQIEKRTSELMVRLHILIDDKPSRDWENITRGINTFRIPEENERMNLFINNPDIIQYNVKFHVLREGSDKEFIETHIAVVEFESFRCTPEKKTVNPNVH